MAWRRTARRLPTWDAARWMACMLMDVGVNYLREHIIQEAQNPQRHYQWRAGTQCGARLCPDLVFCARPHASQVEEIYARVLDIAKGAALMSGTTYDIDFVTGCYDVLPNSVISNLMYEKMHELEPMNFTKQEIAFASNLQKTFPAGSPEFNYQLRKALDSPGGFSKADLANPLWTKVLQHAPTPASHARLDRSGRCQLYHAHRATDHLLLALWHAAPQLADHGLSGSSIGLKGMIFAAKALALTALDLMTKPELLPAAQAEFAANTEGKRYVSPIPAGTVPH